MLVGLVVGDLPLAFARRVLAILIAAAVALAPVGASAATRHVPAKASAHSAHAMHHIKHQGHGAMQAMAGEQTSGKACAHKMGRPCCCDDKGTCAQTCLQKCFGQAAVLPAEGNARVLVAQQFDTRPTERPPGWLSAPQLPPPRV
jgi:hypothetical protein